MASISAFTTAGAALWLGLCGTAAILLIKRHGRKHLFPDQRLMLVALGLLGIAPSTYVLVTILSGGTTLFPSSVQLAAALLIFVASVRARKVRLTDDAMASTKPFAEKSALLVLLGLLALAAVYFGRIWSAPSEPSLSAFISAISLLIALMIVGHIIIALFHAPIDELNDPDDERDRAISLRAMRNSYYVLAVGFWTMPAIILAPLPVVTALNIWFALLVLAEIVHYGSVVALYRYGTI